MTNKTFMETNCPFLYKIHQEGYQQGRKDAMEKIWEASYERMAGKDWKAEQHIILCELLTKLKI